LAGIRAHKPWGPTQGGRGQPHDDPGYRDRCPAPLFYRLRTGSALAALGGALGAPLLPLEPLYPFKYLILVLVIVALSGFGSIRATVFVAILRRHH